MKYANVTASHVFHIGVKGSALADPAISILHIGQAFDWGPSLIDSWTSFNRASPAASQWFVKAAEACEAGLAASPCSISHISTSTSETAGEFPRSAAAERRADRRTRRMEAAAKWEDFKDVSDLRRVQLLLPKCPKKT